MLYSERSVGDIMSGALTSRQFDEKSKIGVQLAQLTACPERLLNWLRKDHFEVPTSWEEGDELSAEGSGKTDSAFDEKS